MTAGMVLGTVQVWLWIGFAVAVLFLGWGIDRIDEDARGAYVFRPLLLPGILLIWPLVLWRWWTLETERDDWRRRHDPPRRAHGYAAAGLTVAIVLALGLGLANRQVWPDGIAPERLAGPPPQAQEAGE